jgi:hypothetical protein
MHQPGKFRAFLLWLFVLNLGIAFGAGLYEAVIEVPHWIVGNPALGHRWDGLAANNANSGMRFWVFVTTGPLTLLTVLNLVASWKIHSALGRWWRFAAVISLGERVFTLAYFIPTMVELMAINASTEPLVIDRALQWEHLNIFRHLLAGGAWLGALKALTHLNRAR